MVGPHGPPSCLLQASRGARPGSVLSSHKALVQPLPDPLSCPWPLCPRCVGNRVPGESLGAQGPAAGAVTGLLEHGTPWLETLGRQDPFVPPHLPGIVTPGSPASPPGAYS